ncbi:MAG TPA: peptide ABC transporter substrate-binding protein, partial [Planctomycetota bacterium]|nr:peptide ABC transporter substrate-binding protein [Planctomycetota bacterium]
VLRTSWGVPTDLDPRRARSAADARYVAALFEGLTAVGPDGRAAAPGVAEAWEQSDDGRTWTFHLRKDARWSNGDPVTAGDFVFAWRRALRGGSEFAPLFRDMKNVGPWLDGLEADAILAQYEDLGGQARARSARLEATARRRHVAALKRRGEEAAARRAEARPDAGEDDLGFRAVDDRTLRIELERRAPWLPHTLAFMAFVPLHRRSLEEHGERWVQPGTMVSNGPYVYSASTPVSLVLTRNARYWDPVAAAAPARIEIGLHTPPVALEKFLDGKLDWVAREQVPDDRRAGLEGVVRGPAWGTFFLRLNLRTAPLDRPEVRRALAQGLDRAAVAKAAGQRTADGLVPPVYPGYPGATAPAHDKAAAMEALLNASGLDLSSLPMIEILTADVFGMAAAAAAVAEQLEKTLGLRARVKVLQVPALLEATALGQFQAAMGGWMGDVFDPSTFLEGWSSSDARHGTGWSNAGFDALLAEAGEEAATDKRLALLARAEALLLGEVPLIPLYGPSDEILAAPSVQGLRPSPAGPYPLKHVRLKS